MADEHDWLEPIGELRTLIARVEGMVTNVETKIDLLPCAERKQRFDTINGRVAALEKDANFARGAARAAGVIWGVIVACLFSGGALVVSIVRFVAGR